MIGKTITGNNISGCLKYVFEGKKDERDAQGNPVQRGEIVGGNMAGSNVGELKKEFDAIMGLKPGISNPVSHHVLTFSSEDLQKIGMPEMVKIAEDYMKERGYENSMYVIVAHRDTKITHLHIVASKIDLKGQVISEWRSKRNDFAVCRDLEKKYGLRELSDKPRNAEKHLSREEIGYKERTGYQTVRETIQKAIADLVVEKVFPETNSNEFASRLQAQGISVRTRAGKDGSIIGMSFAKESPEGKLYAFKGSDLGIAYSWNNLRKLIEINLPDKEFAGGTPSEDKSKNYDEKLLAERILNLFKESVNNQSVAVSEIAWKNFENDLVENFTNQKPSENQLKLIAELKPEEQTRAEELTRLDAIGKILDAASDQQRDSITKNTMELYDKQAKDFLFRKEKENTYEKNHNFSR